MVPASIQAMFRFNTWANEHVREGLLSADEETLRRPLDMWFGSVFNILAHIHGGEAIWLARLRDNDSMAHAPSAVDFPSATALAEAWRAKDGEWETWVGSLSAEQLAADTTGQMRNGSRYSFPLWQPVMQIAFHGTEHRGHATVAMTQLGIKHGAQDFLDQFRTPA